MEKPRRIRRNEEFGVLETIERLDQKIHRYEELWGDITFQGDKLLYFAFHIDVCGHPFRFISDFVTMGIATEADDHDLQYGYGMSPNTECGQHTLKRARELRSWQDDPSMVVIVPVSIFVKQEILRLRTLRDFYEFAIQLDEHVV